MNVLESMKKVYWHQVYRLKTNIHVSTFQLRAQDPPKELRLHRMMQRQIRLSEWHFCGWKYLKRAQIFNSQAVLTYSKCIVTHIITFYRMVSRKASYCIMHKASNTEVKQGKTSGFIPVSQVQDTESPTATDSHTHGTCLALFPSSTVQYERVSAFDSFRFLFRLTGVEPD